MVDTVMGYLTLPRIGLPIVIIQFARINIYKGEVGIQNLMNASKVLWNPEIPEAIEFKNRPASIKDEFLKLYPRKSLYELLQTNEDGCFIILGTVDEVMQESLWWYMACKCMKAVSYDDGVPYCEDCDLYVPDCTPRYKLKLAVSDGSDSVSLILFDSESYSLLGKSCRELLSEKRYTRTCPYPAALMDLVGHEFLFRVEVKDDAVYSFDECFRVRRVSSEPTLIREYTEGLEEETPLKGQALACMCLLFNASVTEIDVSPLSNDPSPSVGEDSGSASKREPGHATECATEKKKRGRGKSIKLERT
ncbi:hypothetical protein SESBI_13817 [Sesbania bispinosa]|nr:hypothetical protein SESBI_13817 [Sesbania bispinosa]